MTPAPSASNPTAENGDPMSLDFTSFAASPKAAPPVASPPIVATAAAAPLELLPLDFEPVRPPAAEATAVAAEAVQPPAPAAAPVAVPAAAAPAIKSASLAGTLNARVRDPLKQILAAAERVPVRLDLSRIAAVDDEGCALLDAALRTARRERPGMHLAGAAHMAELLAKLAVGTERRHEAAWLLQAELQIWLERPEAFEETAIGYAIAFEVSPPSWEAPPVGRCDN